jgi:hypothetical protein
MHILASLSPTQAIGAGCFGAVIGWFTYFVNRYRGGDVELKDISTLIGALGGGVILTLFPEKTDLFGAYGIGLAVGFFGYFISLVISVLASEDFTADWFLDGRRPALRDGQIGLPPGERPAMGLDDHAGDGVINP